jgi:hypothetical protein
MVEIHRKSARLVINRPQRDVLMKLKLIIIVFTS